MIVAIHPALHKLHIPCRRKALSQGLESIDEIVAMYALVNRLFVSASALEAAEAFVNTLVEKYSDQNMSIDQITSVALEQRRSPERFSPKV
jgi:hypothetical protein